MLAIITQITYPLYFLTLSLALATGAVVGVFIFKRRSNKASRERNELYDFLFEKTPVGLHISSFNAKGKRISLFVNPAHSRITGIPDSKVDDIETLEAATHPEDYKKQTELIEKLYRGEITTFTFEKRYLKEEESHRWHWAELTFFRNQLPKGGYQIIATIVDHDKLKTTEREVQRQADLIQMIIDASPVGLSAFIYQSDGTYRRIANQAHATITGVPLDNTDNEAYRKATHPDDLIGQEKVSKLAKAEKRDHFRFQKRYIHPDGEIVWVDFFSRTKTYPETGEEIQISCINDITQLKHAIEQAELAVDEANRANRAKSDFLAMMSHEIRTPMNGVIGMTSILKVMGLPPQQLECVETIRLSGESLLAIINDILDFSKIESGNLQLESEQFELRPCLEGALDLLATKASEQYIDLLYQINDSVPSQIFGDSNRLRQVVVNLLGNAIKFTHKGHVLLAVSSEIIENENKINLTIAIEDTGIGISEEKIEALFKPFTQADSSTTREYGGTGLGLSISQRIIQLMGGEITITSQKGQGSTFKFTIPVQCLPAQRKFHPSSISNRLSNQRVLIVDDNPTNLKILNAWLREWGMHPVEFIEPKKALSSLESDDDYGAAILDMNMPEMDGQTLAKSIQETMGAKAFPLILLSSLDEAHTQINRDLFQSILLKPTKPHQLRDALVRSLFKNNTYQTKKLSAPTIVAETNTDHQNKSILVVEDNAVNQKVVSMMLKQLGHSADVAGNGFEAIDALKRQPYDIILMDMIMPEMDGLTATQKIREQNGEGNEQKPYIIALTANAMQGDRETCLDVGMNAYLTKPIQIEALLHELNKALDS